MKKGQLIANTRRLLDIYRMEHDLGDKDLKTVLYHSLNNNGFVVKEAAEDIGISLKTFSRLCDREGVIFETVAFRKVKIPWDRLYENVYDLIKEFNCTIQTVYRQRRRYGQIKSPRPPGFYSFNSSEDVGESSDTPGNSDGESEG